MSDAVLDLKVLLWNVENLFLLSDIPLSSEHLKLEESQWQKLSTSVHPNKSLFKCRGIANIIQENDPDVILFCEVGGQESLSNFNKLFLNDAYSPALVEGNSDRNIDLGFLIKKKQGFYFDLFSNRNRPINFLYPHEREVLEVVSGTPNQKPSHKFSRDVAELHCFVRDREKPFLIFMLAHLKSQLDRDRIDPQGFERRQAELITLTQIYNELHAKHPSTPIAVCGDFNGSARKSKLDPEFKTLYEKTDLVDLSDWAGVPESDGATFYQVGRAPNPEGRQIDYCFASPNLIPYLKPASFSVYRFKDPRGVVLDPPTTIEGKQNLPSDHYPLRFEIKSLPLF